MSITLAFDIYGTLLDTQGVVKLLENIVGNEAIQFAQAWRNKQLEYTFRRGLMKKYQQFSICINDSLEYTCAYYKKELSREQKEILLDAYLKLPPFNDVKEGLTSVNSSEFKLYAFSNGSKNVIENLLNSADIKDFFIDIISVDDVKSFKPDPAVYQHFMKKSGSNGDDAWLISSNPFDVIGAISAGMRSAWIQRSKETVYDPWGIAPTITLSSLFNLKQKILNY
jgi:2-haloacid dehalogenase